ncbi:predicted protein [Naegleria gruberi]|uniref:Predicted protein n=1 Tax=Naegleria gruberi TaxID=5762 RepID=D2VBI7_NAEGR|nr:uncharacterized protein NAEGRDRAFT_66231 [Naegleria gruberi]EFC45805.1 predicted protein [Naegleria gruberi]|eukprot:XP_002678549.1 predicted protein [Naegleria gruberi strain NEG-M]
MSFFVDRYCSNSSSIPLTLTTDGPFQTSNILDDEKKSIVPTKDEGFDTIIEQPVKLTILNRDRIEFNHQGLIVDGLIFVHSMLVDSDTDSGPLSHVHWIFTQWMKIKPNGRIIVILIEKDFDRLCDSLKSKKTFEQFQTWLSKTCCKYFPFPIYTVQISNSNFSQLKRDETLLFSTLFYYQSLAASESLVLTSPFISQSLAQLSGANTTASTRHKKFFKQECNLDDSCIYFNSDLYFKMSKIGLLLLDFSSISEISIAEINSIQMEQKFALCQLDYRTNQPSYFKQIEFVQLNDWKPDGKSISKFIGRFPLVQELTVNHTNNFSIGIFKDIQKKEIKSILFGVILDTHHIKQFSSQNDFNNFVQYYERINEYSVSNQMNNAIETMNNERKRFSPKQTSRLSKGLEVGTNSPSSSKSQASAPVTTSDGKTSDIYQFPVTDMSISSICDYFGLLTFQKGRDMETQIYDVMVKLIPEKPNHFKLYAKCSSATEKDTFYREEILMKQGKIVKGICTCPIGSQGKCKHVCASILSYVSIISNRNMGNEQKIEEKEKILKSGSLGSQSESQLSESKVISQDPPPVSFAVKPESSVEPSQEPKKKKTLPSWMGGSKEKPQKSSSTKSDSKSDLKKPKTSFFLYCDEYRDAVKEELGGKVAASEVAKELGARWKQLSEEEKQVYVDKHKELANEYAEKKKEIKSKNKTDSESTSTNEKPKTNKKKVKKESVDNDPIEESDEEEDESFGNIFFSKQKQKSSEAKQESKDSSIRPIPEMSPENVTKSKPQPATIVKKEQRSDDEDEAFGNIFFSKPSSKPSVVTTSEKPVLNSVPSVIIKQEPQSPKKRKLPSPVKPTVQKQNEEDESSDEDVGSIFFATSKKKKPNNLEETNVKPVKPVLQSNTVEERKPIHETKQAMDESDDEDASSIFFSSSKKKPNVETKKEQLITPISSTTEKKDSNLGKDRMEESDDDEEGGIANIFFSKQTKKKPSSPIITKQSTVSNTSALSSNISSTSKPTLAPNNKKDMDETDDDEEDVSFANIFFSKSTKKQPPPASSSTNSSTSSVPKPSSSSPSKTNNQEKNTKKVTSLKAMMAEFDF